MARLLKFLSGLFISIICFTTVVFGAEFNSDGLEIFNSSFSEYQGNLSSDVYGKFYDSFIVEGGKLHFKCADLSSFKNKNMFLLFCGSEAFGRSYPNQKVLNCPSNIKAYLVGKHSSDAKGWHFNGFNLDGSIQFDRYSLMSGILLCFGDVGSSCDIIFDTYDDCGKNLTFDNLLSKQDCLKLLNVKIVDSKPKPKPVKPKPKKDNIPEEKPPHITGDIKMTSGENVLDGIVNVIKGFFKVLAFWGKKIIGFAIGLGIIFVGAKWLWRKLREWLNSI